MGAVDAVISVLIAFILIYVGAVVLWALNPFLAVLFVVAALYIALRGLGRTGEGL